MTKYKQNPKVFTKKINGEIIIYNPISGKLHRLNEMAEFIWINLSKKTSTEEILNKIIQEYEVDYKKVNQDIADFIDDFYKQKLISKLPDNYSSKNKSW